ncbi:hypothetical protein BKA70DRAFT_1278587 [Coprinopsis sp. MPI-PUGE-AT-0042]|nr:hypothetical protein BKA70DRAFT_1278587 [Coprinopsis sp. MPI-PUGE-AT-0042]
MSTIPLPEFDDDPTLSLPTSMEQLDLNQGGPPRKSPQERLRVRPLSVLAGGVGTIGLATPPPSGPLPPPPPGSPGASYPSTASPNVPAFLNSMSTSESPSHRSRNVSPTGSVVNSGSGSIPSTPSFTGPSQPPSSYTQSQPLPQLPTFAHGLHTIDEHHVSKDDLDMGLDVDRRVIKKEASRSPHRIPVGASDQGYEDDFASNRGGLPFDYDNQSSLQYTSIFPLPNHSTAHQELPSHALGVPSSHSTGSLTHSGQGYGTITVSNSVSSFPASNGAAVPPSVTTPLARDAALGAHGSTASVPNGMVSAASMSEADSSKTPNVYINGLPPHFPEDQLYALAAPFGEVKSVRTFTRHVRDSESGYGFVLFETVDSAERCIASLRRYRNLHPTFSKQIHKIPGTVYARAKVDPVSHVSPSDNWTGTEEDQDASFKARMEALADPLSTNLYMEGLPLSIDEPTLAALVTPHRIVSSRFFQTRLSNPPRIIAFVRLDTRHGAEEIVERLHGRMVRGWNDTGSRISVRFADTAEQRELRRQERALKEGNLVGDASPARLTIAQAALLNLRGHDLHAEALAPSLPPPPSAAPTIASPYPVIGQKGYEWSGQDLLPPRGLSSVDQEPIGASREYGLAPSPEALSRSGGNRGARLGNGAPDLEYASAFAIGSLPPRNQQRVYASDRHAGFSQAPIRLADQILQPQSTLSSVDPTIKARLSFLNGGNSFSASSGQRELYRQQLEQQLQQEYHNQQLQQTLYSGGMSQAVGYGGSGVASTHTGYTAAEEFIMRQHLERQRHASMSGVDTTSFLQHQQSRKARPSPLDLRRKEDARTGFQPSKAVGGSMSAEDSFHAQGAPMFGSADHGMKTLNNATYHQTAIDPQPSHHAHMRSNTLPHNRTIVAPHTAPITQGVQGSQLPQSQKHYSRNSLSLSSASALQTPQHASSTTMAPPLDITVQDQSNHTQHLRRGSVNGEVALSSTGKTNSGNISPSTSVSSSHSPSMISPALTYSSQTPSTLSPATPFFGSFNSQGDGFKSIESQNATHLNVKANPSKMIGGVRMAHGQQAN